MKIVDIKVRQSESIIEDTETLFEDSLVVSPTDIFPWFNRPKGRIGVVPYPIENGVFRITHNYLQIDTDEGLSGVAGPISNPAPAFYLLTQLKPVLLGQDPLSTEYLWEIMYRIALDGRKGENMHAIGYADIALWDIKAKWLGLPLHRLLGGPVQKRILAYANTAGCSLEANKVRKRVEDSKKSRLQGNQVVCTVWTGPWRRRYPKNDRPD